jgi:hypothetical protein
VVLGSKVQKENEKVKYGVYKFDIGHHTRKEYKYGGYG